MDWVQHPDLVPPGLADLARVVNGDDTTMGSHVVANADGFCKAHNVHTVHADTRPKQGPCEVPLE